MIPIFPCKANKDLKKKIFGNMRCLYGFEETGGFIRVGGSGNGRNLSERQFGNMNQI